MKEYSDYTRLKQTGDDGEQKFITFLESRGFSNIQHIDDIKDAEGLEYSDYDIRATNPQGQTITYEVKTQHDCHKYGMVNVEQVQNGKPAGIATSKADIWVFANKKKGFGCIKAHKLKKIHQVIRSDASITRVTYSMKQKVHGYQLWVTEWKNFAAGWRMKLDELEWFKPEINE